MKIIGVTGPSGSGKTCMLEYLKQRGAKVICADSVYHDLYENNKPMRGAIMSRFNTLDRKVLGQTVFGDSQALRDLEAITHPFVVNVINASLKTLRAEMSEVVIVEAIALFESGLAELCDTVIYVTADREKLINRIVERDRISREYAEARLKSRDFTGNATYVIQNNGDLMSLYSQVDKIYREAIS